MRTVIPYKILLAFIMLPLFVLASPKLDGKYTKKKVINKTYSVSSNATLKVNNSYGNIDIITWNENRIVFEVTITTSGNDEEKVQKKLDNIGVDFEEASNFVSAKTIFSKSKSSSWWSWGNNNNVNMKINYVIKIPITNHVDLNNDYGSINLDKLEGVAKISCDYGKITTKELMADNNDINFDYTKGCYFEYIKSGKINADYSDFTVSKSQKINITADYTNSKIEVAEDVNYNCDYGSIKIEKANNIIGKENYLTTYIGDVYKNISLNSDYGSIKINRLTKNAENITIKADYVGVKIGYDATHDFTFDIDLDYASLRDSDGLIFTKKIVESTSKHYIGYHGDANSKNTVNIVSDYGSVSLVKK
ncbi:hypothetical protein [Thalassobellus citreus]|uniref:hypothetical protein n=1 Tax=Thalassobellus citreus TaxID=3367752 RepID=UPI00379424A2